MARVAITGATGHLGSSLVRQLLERGDEVRALVREPDPPELQGLSLELVQGDVARNEGLDELVDGVDLLYHLAAQISIVGSMNGLVEAVNVGGVRHVVEAARRARVPRMVHTCSVHAFSHTPLDEPVDETRRRVRRGDAPAYDVSKAQGEAVVREAVAQGLDAVIVHPSAVLGPYDYKPSRMGQVLLMLYRRRLPALLPGGYDFVDARDVSASMIAAAEHGRTNESYLLTGRYQQITELAEAVERITGVPRPPLSVPMWIAKLGAPFMDVASRYMSGEPLYTSESLLPLALRHGFDSSKAQRELGHSIRPTEDTLRDVFRWYLAEGVVAPKTEHSRALRSQSVSAA